MYTGLTVSEITLPYTKRLPLKKPKVLSLMKPSGLTFISMEVDLSESCSGEPFTVSRFKKKTLIVFELAITVGVTYCDHG